MKKIFTILLFLTAGQLASAQTEDVTVTIAKSEFKAKQVIPPSPIAAELGKYGNTPVSLFTGTPNISIPLFDLKGTLLSLPISLSYNASGFKPAEMAPWTGSGWSLNAGGVITRSVLGNPDISSNYFACPYPLTPPALPNTNIFPYYDYMNSVQNALVEPQPDMYYFNFAGHTGKFELKPDQTVLKKRKDMLVITSGILAANSNFTIKDEQGNIYTFSDVETSRTQPNDEAGQGNGPPYSYPSSWFLTKVVTADGNEEMDFTYYATTGEQTIYPDNSQSQSSSYKYQTNNPGNLYCNPPVVSGYIGVAPTTYIKKKFLQNITLLKAGQEVGHIDFISTAGRQDSDFPEDRILNQVNVYTPNPIGVAPRLIKRYNLSYSYFGTSPNYRLRLDGVQEMAVDATTTSKSPYQFTYNTGIGNPDRFTKSLDHWGFFNNSGNTTLVPADVELGNNGAMVNVGLNANRAPDINGSSCNILNKIQYPTGGYTIFNYELNTAKDSSGHFQYVGGLRVNNIVDYSATNQQSTIKTYSYLLDDNTTSGVAQFPVYIKTTKSSHLIQPCASQNPGDCTPCQLVTVPFLFTTYTVSTNSIYGLGSFAGSQVGYTEVTESQKDINTNIPLGKTVYKYNVGLSGTPFSYGHDEDISNGDLAEQTVYDGNGKMIKDVINTYTYSNLGGTTAYLVKPNSFQTNADYFYEKSDGTYSQLYPWITPPSGVIASRELFTQLFVDQYNFSNQYSQLTQKTEKTYDQASGLYKTQSLNYVYGNPLHIYPTQTTVTSTGNTQVITQKIYAGDYPYTGATTDTAASAIIVLKNNNMLGAEIESLQYRQNADGTNKRYINGSLTTYLSTPLPTPYKIYSLESIIPLGTVTSSSINGSGVFTYDSHYKIAGTFKYLNNNLIEQSKAYGPVTSYLWDYSQTEPVASVTNTHSTNIAYTGFETSSISNNWLSHLVLLDTITVFTGRASGVLSTGSKIDATFTVAPPQSIVSYWASGPATVMSNTTVNVPVSSQGLTANGWTYYEHLLPAGTTQVELTGAIHIDELRLYPVLSQMQTESYDPLVGVTSQVSPGSQVLNYKYDGLNRLTTIKDVYGNIKQNLVYNYGPGVAVTAPTQTLFFNSLQQQSFTKQGCTGSTPTSVVYQVPYGRYSAATQVAADQLALNDIAANGQTYANVNGLCLYYNDQAYSRKFFKNDCTSSQGLGSPVVYTVSAGTVYSLISIADADVQAQNQLTNTGQAYANTHGTCSCGAEGQKMINGTCTTGQKIYISSTPSNGQYICVYEYMFSDGTYSQTYTVTSPTNCVNN